MTDTQAAPAADSTTAPGQQAATEQPGTPAAPSPADLAARATQQQAAAPAPTEGGENRGPAVDMTGWPQAAIDAYRARDEQANTWHAEAVKSRVNAKAKAADEARADTLQKIAVALGIAQQDEAPTVEKVTAELTSTTAERDQATKEAALLRAAIANRVDPSKLDYLTFLATREQSYRDASPSADGFADTIANTVKTIVATDPSLTGAAPAAKSGADTYGGASGSELTLDAFQAMNARERTQLYQQDPATYQRLNDAAWQATRAK